MQHIITLILIEVIVLLSSMTIHNVKEIWYGEQQVSGVRKEVGRRKSKRRNEEGEGSYVVEKSCKPEDAIQVWIWFWNYQGASDPPSSRASFRDACKSKSGLGGTPKTFRFVLSTIIQELGSLGYHHEDSERMIGLVWYSWFRLYIAVPCLSVIWVVIAEIQISIQRSVDYYL